MRVKWGEVVAAAYLGVIVTHFYNPYIPCSTVRISVNGLDQFDRAVIWTFRVKNTDRRQNVGFGGTPKIRFPFTPYPTFRSKRWFKNMDVEFLLKSVVLHSISRSARYSCPAVSVRISNEEVAWIVFVVKCRLYARWSQEVYGRCILIYVTLCTLDMLCSGLEMENIMNTVNR
jgi:hypothetical protein